MVLGKLWKVYRGGLEYWVVGLLQPVIDNLKKPDYVERVEIKQFSLGNEPLSVRHVERRTSRRVNDLQCYLVLVVLRGELADILRGELIKMEYFIQFNTRSRAQNRMIQQANKHRTDRSFKVGEYFVKLQPYRQQSVVNRSSQKLSKRYYGPYAIIEKIGNVAYKLDLPPASSIHPVFHVSVLREYVGSPPSSLEPLPTLPPTSLIPETILSTNENVSPPQLLVKWFNLPNEEATWEPKPEFVRRYPNFDLEDKVNSEDAGNDATTKDLPRLFVRPNKIVLDFQNGKAVGPVRNDFKTGEVQEGNKDFVGELSVTLVDARKLTYAFFGISTDLYALFFKSVRLGDQVIRSKKNSQTTVIGAPGEPIWNQDFYMLVTNPRKQKLSIQVKDFLGLADTTIGSREYKPIYMEQAAATYGTRVNESGTSKEAFMGVLAALLVSEEFQGIVASETANAKYATDVRNSESKETPLGAVSAPDLKKSEDNSRGKRLSRMTSLVLACCDHKYLDTYSTQRGRLKYFQSMMTCKKLQFFEAAPISIQRGRKELDVKSSHQEEMKIIIIDWIMGDSQYSFSLTTFSPSGKLVQIEHALTAVGSGQTSLGIKASNGVVIATEKKLPSILVDETSLFGCSYKEGLVVRHLTSSQEVKGSNLTRYTFGGGKEEPEMVMGLPPVQKIQLLTPNIGVVYRSIVSAFPDISNFCSGMGPDSRVLVRKSRKQAEQYHRLYKEPIPVTQLVRETAAVMQEFTQSGGVRPFGVSLLVAGFDDKGPQLYQVDPSGSYFSWKASAMGKNVSNAKTFLEKRYTDDMELDDAVHTAILTLKEGVLTPAEIEDYLQEVE
ncbi:proteasome subunit alpha type-2-A [Tanacetum coccineum]